MDGLLGTGRDVLVARDHALADLDTLTRRSPAALLTGEAGIGKSHLAQAYAARVRGRGLPVGHVIALAALSETPLAALRPLVGVGPAAHRDPVAWATGRLVQDHAAGLLVVDDADALDDTSAATLHRVTQLPRAQNPPRLVLTLRRGQALPSPLERLLTEGTLEQLRVGPLPRYGVGQYAERLLDGPLEETAVHELTARSGGNPLFVREIVLAAWEQQSWQRGPGGWRLTGPVSTPDRIQPLVDARLSGLPAPVRRLADMLAVAGPMPLEVLIPLGLVGAVSHLEGAGIGRVSAGEVALSHPLFAETLQMGLDTAARADWTQRLLDVATEVDLPAGPTVRLVALALDQGRHIDGDRLTTAARMALALFDPATARDLADAAIRADDTPAAAVLAAQARALLGDPAGQTALVELSAASDERVRNEARLTRVRLGIAAEDGATTALELLESAPATAARETMRAVALMRLNSWVQATEAADAALGRAEGAAQWVDAAGIGALLHTWGGDPALAVRLTERGLSSIDAGVLCGPHAPVVLAQSGSVAALLCGETETADRIAGYGGDDPVESPYFAAHRLLRTGVLACHRGHPVAATLLDSASSMLMAGDPVELRSWAYAFLARSLVRLGRLQDAQNAAKSGRAVAFHGQVAPEVELRVSEAWVAAAAAGPEATGTALRPLIDLADSQSVEVPGSAGLIGVDIARLGDLEEAGRVLADATARSGSRALQRATDLVEAALAADPARVCAAALGVQELGLHIWAADLLAVASWHAPANRRELLQARAQVAASACGGPGTPALAATSAPLTATQLRVAELASRGWSNREVGERLDMSPRTAATHLHRAYKLLDVHDRDQLARLFPARPSD
ncbi:MAG TPA: LuxR C-terminal-related transcriptional regulator [Nocardioidaceae bacterium]|nr:LuxR C-terminal-related transcriptional regulator [Nocardioidaceae bacterium]